MLGTLLAALRSGDALDKAFNEFDEMLSDRAHFFEAEIKLSV